MLMAHVRFYKDVEKDNYENGCTGGLRPVHFESFHTPFNNKEDLLQQLADWTASHFDVRVADFMQHIENECENNRFDYAQNEDADGEYTVLGPDNPNGYYASYQYLIDVYQPIEYKF